MTNPLVSFTVMCYNTERYVRECIESILAQEDIQDFEIVAIDDCSTDGTRDVLRSFRDPRIRLILHERNLGPMPTATEVLRAARGRFVTRFDSDDRYRPGFLRMLLPYFERHPNVGLVYGDAALIGPQGEWYADRMDTKHEGADFCGNELIALLEKNFVCNPSVIARREAWLSCLPIPDDFVLGDWYLSVEIARRWNFYYRNEVVADYRIHPGNFHNSTLRGGREERQILSTLDRIFGQKEDSPELELAKRNARRRIYATNYLTLADKYFGSGEAEDARRCYWAAIRNNPLLGTQPVVLRRLSATFIGLDTYARAKGLLRS